MKKFLMLVLMSVSFVSVAGVDPLDNVGNRCAPNDLLYYGQTVDHKREVLVCQNRENLIYSFGQIGKKVDIKLTIPLQMADDLVTDNDTVSSEYLMIRSGNIIYQVGHLTDLVSGADVDSITVIKHGEGKLKEIMLDPNSVANAIRDNFFKGH